MSEKYKIRLDREGKKKIDEILRLGLTIMSISDLTGINHNTIRYHIISSGQLPEYKKARKIVIEEPRKKRAVKNLIYTLKSIAYKKYLEEHPRYKQYKEKEREKRTFVPDEDKNTIKRAFYSDLSTADAIYFTNIREESISGYFNQIGHRETKIKPYKIGDKKFSYSQLSQIYKFWDEDNIIEVEKIKESQLENILDNRAILEPRIIEQLKILYPDRVIEKGYLTK